ncbi:hypothetical protein CesoFtcFv8_010600 [Champsocephalus esox]|uniref:Uncharacterized protein n=1 Tax=Champsocephalus esox TaxID=159716 RepID=A0AAN8GZW8_9TELE|nr:hypothetical protein CesoFtcFv8_010600 [Champsocephalus esox]
MCIRPSSGVQLRFHSHTGFLSRFHLENRAIVPCLVGVMDYLHFCLTSALPLPTSSCYCLVQWPPINHTVL